MNLKNVLREFCLEECKERRNLDNSNQLTALENPPEEFRKVAKAILSGHFRVQNSRTSEHIEVHPTCVEIYYHEEQANGVKDPIVYHRNRKKKKKSDDDNPIVFPLGVLHNHVSGIDITFESEANSKNKYVTGIVRASALIREFSVKIWKTEKGKITEKVIEKEDRSTYIYEYLFGQFSIFDGFKITWEGDFEEKDLDDIKLICNSRKNVMEYIEPNTDSDKKEYDYQKNGITCKRAWQFLIDNTSK